MSKVVIENIEYQGDVELVRNKLKCKCGSGVFTYHTCKSLNTFTLNCFDCGKQIIGVYKNVK